LGRRAETGPVERIDGGQQKVTDLAINQFVDNGLSQKGGR